MIFKITILFIFILKISLILRNLLLLTNIAKYNQIIHSLFEYKNFIYLSKFKMINNNIKDKKNLIF